MKTIKSFIKDFAKFALKPLRIRLATLAAQDEQLRQELSTLKIELIAENDILKANILTLTAHNEHLEQALSVIKENNLILLQEKNQLESRVSRIEEDYKLYIHTSSNSLLPFSDIQNPSYTDPKVSIIMPTWNRAAIISEAIISIINQSFKYWELIIIDDGSSDDTIKAVEPFLKDNRISYQRFNHQGVSKTRNNGLAAAKGEYIAYLDSDNIWYPNFLAYAVKELDAHPDLGFVYATLVSDCHGDKMLLGKAFDKNSLLEGNYIDLNVLVHRIDLFKSYGGFDESLDRMVDWDLILKYSQNTSAKLLPILGAYYRELDNIRLTKNNLLHLNYFKIIQKHPPKHKSNSRTIKILYVVWHYPQLSETYIETEIIQMRRWGYDIHVWRETFPVSPYFSDIPIYDGDLKDTIERLKPDLIHVHWLSFFLSKEPILKLFDIPITVKLHGFEVTQNSLEQALSLPSVRAVYGFPHHQFLSDHSKLKSIRSAFNTDLFHPLKSKNRKLIVRTGAALASKDLLTFIALAKKLSNFRFVLALVTCNEREYFVDEIRRFAERENSPVEIMVDVPRASLAPLIAEAGIYFHTANPPGTSDSFPIGMPISIAEAMATGAHIFVRNLDELIAYVGNAGTSYADIEDAFNLIKSTEEWTDAQWNQAWFNSVERAFQYHADEIVYRPLFEDWQAFALDNGKNLPAHPGNHHAATAEA